MPTSACVCVYMCMCKLRVWRADKGLSILSGYKETLLLAENNRHLVATSATIIKTDNSSTHHNQVIASSYAEIPLINLVLIQQLHHNEAVFGKRYNSCELRGWLRLQRIRSRVTLILWKCLQEKLCILGRECKKICLWDGFGRGETLRFGIPERAKSYRITWWKDTLKHTHSRTQNQFTTDTLAWAVWGPPWRWDQ